MNDNGYENSLNLYRSDGSIMLPVARKLSRGSNHTLRQAAEMMVRHNCGDIAIVESVENLKPIGVITDRDIAWCVVAKGKSPARDAVEPSVTVTPKSFYGALASGSKEVK